MAPDFVERVTKNLKAPPKPVEHKHPFDIYQVPEEEREPLVNEADRIVRRTFSSPQALDRYLARDGAADAARLEVEARLAIEAKRAEEATKLAEREERRLTAELDRRARTGR